MKKKIIIISLCVNLLAVLFVLYSFIPNEKKNTNEGGSGYIIINADYWMGKLSVVDGNSVLETKEIHTIQGYSSYVKLSENNQVIAKELNDYNAKGYVLESSNTSTLGAVNWVFNYVMRKK